MSLPYTSYVSVGAKNTNSTKLCVLGSTGICQLVGPNNTLFSVAKQENDVIFRHVSITLNTIEISVIFYCSCCGYSDGFMEIYPWSFR